MRFYGIRKFDKLALQSKAVLLAEYIPHPHGFAPKPP